MMNNFPLPFPPMNNNYCYNFQDELSVLKAKIDSLEKRIEILEKKKEQNYLKKEDNYYMI